MAVELEPATSLEVASVIVLCQESDYPCRAGVVRRLEAERDSLKAEVERLRGLLEKIEWQLCETVGLEPDVEAELAKIGDAARERDRLAREAANRKDLED